jgi:hypothetical protein
MIGLQSEFLDIVFPVIESAIPVCNAFWKGHAEALAIEVSVTSSLSTLFALLAASFVSFRGAGHRFYVNKVNKDNSAVHRDAAHRRSDCGALWANWCWSSFVD